MKPMLADTSDSVDAVIASKFGPPRHQRSLSDCDVAAEHPLTTGLPARKSEGNLLLRAEEEEEESVVESREGGETDKQEIAVYWSKTPVRLHIAQEAIQQKIQHRHQLQMALEAADWCQVLTIVEEHPYLKHDLSFEFVVQGEKCYGLPLHVAICDPSCPRHIVQLMLSSHALETPETRRGRIPLHLALLRDAKAETIDLLLGFSTSLTRPDSWGCVALHYAVEFARPEIIGKVLRAHPQAAGIMTYRRRYPLHLAAAERSSCFDGGALDAQIIRELIDAHPSALHFPEMQGRLPLHLACANPYPKWELLQILIDAYPAALLNLDKGRKTPLDLLKLFAASSEEQNVVRSFLQDRTNAERRRRKSLIFNKLWRRGNRSQKPENEDATLTNLMNCYG